ncbi:ATP-binding protein [Embleya sp. NPDC008237]|uniref:ATP-binding protein n=1 Tax=Embleya sp. NPDC008237 TaxID=3363978 RepID=UPI0036ED3FFE
MTTPSSRAGDATRARLWGRDAERAAIAAVIERAREGRGAVLVLRGPAGIGKSALLDEAAREAADVRVLRVAGVEAEAGLPFAALQALLRPVVHRLDTLPDVQAAALRGALGLAAARAPPSAGARRASASRRGPGRAGPRGRSRSRCAVGRCSPTRLRRASGTPPEGDAPTGSASAVGATGSVSEAAVRPRRPVTGPGCRWSPTGWAQWPHDDAEHPSVP